MLCNVIACDVQKYVIICHHVHRIELFLFCVEKQGVDLIPDRHVLINDTGITDKRFF